MNLLIILLLAFPRPDCPPVSGADVERALALEQSIFLSAELRPRPDRFEARDRIAGRFVLGYEPGRLSDLLQWLDRQGGSPVRVDTGAGFIVCLLPDAVGLALAAEPLPAGGRWFEPDAETRAAHIPNDPFFASHQWDKWVMYADKAWDITRGSADITIAVCDNGVEYTHPDLIDRFIPGSWGYDFVRNDNDPKPDNPSIPQAYHGTHVAGIAAATMDNSIGIAGWAGSRLLAVKVLNDSGSGTMSNLASGIRWAADNGARVINMSLGSNDHSTAVAEAARYATDRGVLLIAAAGNAGAGVVQYPARLPDVVCVGATDSTGSLAYYSNYGSDQELVAPGSAIPSCWTGAQYGLSWGTSMAAPQVAGVAALVMAVDPSLGPTRVRAILAASAIDLGAAGWNNRYGYGLVNAWRACMLAVRMMDRPMPGHAARLARPGVIAGTYRLPDWAESAELYDAAGRGRKIEGRELVLSPGAWFVRLRGPGRTEFVRLTSVR